MIKFLQFIRAKSQLAFLSGQCVLGSQTHNYLFSIDSGQDRHTDIKFFPVYHLCDTAVLGFSFLGDIHTADNLDTCHNGRKQSDTVSSLFIKSAVNTIADPYLAFHGFDMDIGSTLSDRLIDHAFYQLYNRRIIDILTVHILLFHHLTFFFPGVFFQCRVHFRLSIVTVKCQHNAASGGYHRFHL